MAPARARWARSSRTTPRRRRSRCSMPSLARGSCAMYDVTSRTPSTRPLFARRSSPACPPRSGRPRCSPHLAGPRRYLSPGKTTPSGSTRRRPPAVVYDRLIAGDGVTPGTIGPDLTTVPPNPAVDPKNFIDVTIHQKRIWFVQKDSTLGWYLPANQVWGKARMFDFGPLFKRGGYLQSLATWTVDDGDGSRHLLVAFGSEGDVAVYGAPTSIRRCSWQLQGVFYAGPLMAGHRFHAKVSGDLKFLTTAGADQHERHADLHAGHLPAEQHRGAGRSSSSLRSRQPLRFPPGWDMKFVPSVNMLLINIPGLTAEGALQVARTSSTRSGRLLPGHGRDLLLPGLHDGVPLRHRPRARQAGLDRQRRRGNNSDNPQGIPITALVQQAYNYFGTPANNKQVGLFRPNFLRPQAVAVEGDHPATTSISTRRPSSSNPVQSPAPLWDRPSGTSRCGRAASTLRSSGPAAAGYGFAGSLAMATKL